MSNEIQVLKEALALAQQTLSGIASYNWHKRGPEDAEVKAEAFERWAKSRADYTVAQIEKLLSTQMTKEAPKPCRSPYCECELGKCSHPGFYDARHFPIHGEVSA